MNTPHEMTRLQSAAHRCVLAVCLLGLVLLARTPVAHAATYSGWYSNSTWVDDGASTYYPFNADAGLKPGDSVQFCATVHGIWNNRLWFYVEDGEDNLLSGEYHIHQYCSWYRVPSDGQLNVFLDNSDGRLSRYVAVRYRYYVADHYQAPRRPAPPQPTATPDTTGTNTTTVSGNANNTPVSSYTPPSSPANGCTITASSSGITTCGPCTIMGVSGGIISCGTCTFVNSNTSGGIISCGTCAFIGSNSKSGGIITCNTVSAGVKPQ